MDHHRVDVRDLVVAAVQPNLEWLAPEKNLAYLDEMILALPHKVDLIVLPEMFASGFTQKPESIASGNRALEWMHQQAERHDAAIVGSVACEVEPGHYVNRLLFVTPQGEAKHYDKTHLFRMADEHKRYFAGKDRKVIHYRGWRLLLSVCYDLRFPVFCRNRQDYDLMLCVANWPEVRRHAWRTLLTARAIENQAYVVGVNRVGTDGNGLQYRGDSMIVNYQGEPLVDGDDGNEQVLFSSLSMSALQEARESFPVWQDADSFTLG